MAIAPEGGLAAQQDIDETSCSQKSRLAKFNLSTGLVSLAGNPLIMRALVGGLRMNYVVANLIAVATCSLLNFLLSDRFVFEG